MKRVCYLLFTRVERPSFIFPEKYQSLCQGIFFITNHFSALYEASIFLSKAFSSSNAA